jgi:hypothetical protein
MTGRPSESHLLSIAEAARLIEAKRLSPVELVEGLLARKDRDFVQEPMSVVRFS